MGSEISPPTPTPNLMKGRYDHIAVTPRMPGFGAWIDHVDLASELSEAVCGELRKAWLEFGVVFFRGQTRLSPERQAQLTHIFGAGPYAGNSQNIQRTGEKHVELLVTDESKPPFADSWHTDISWSPEPPVGTLIQIQEKPSVGGNTCWSCTRKAYSALSRPMQEMLAQLHALHAHVSPRIIAQKTFNVDQMARILKADPPALHPVVMRHPITGSHSLYVNELWTVNIEGMHTMESKALLQALFDWQRLPEFQLQHEWEENGVAVWDNYSTLHYAVADYYPARRVNQRVMFHMR